MAQAKAVFTVMEIKDSDKGVFRRIGTAFDNQDGSMNVLLDAYPVNGRLHIREVDDTRRERQPQAGNRHSDQQPL